MNWISVKDRLPEVRKDVLVYDKEYGTRLAYWHDQYEPYEWYECTGCGNTLEYITHWMPLPGEPDVKKD